MKNNIYRYSLMWVFFQTLVLLFWGDIDIVSFDLLPLPVWKINHYFKGGYDLTEYIIYALIPMIISLLYVKFYICEESKNAKSQDTTIFKNNRYFFIVTALIALIIFIPWLFYDFNFTPISKPEEQSLETESVEEEKNENTDSETEFNDESIVPLPSSEQPSSSPAPKSP